MGGASLSVCAAGAGASRPRAAGRRAQAATSVADAANAQAAMILEVRLSRMRIGTRPFVG
jgi:hypothetical protein